MKRVALPVALAALVYAGTASAQSAGAQPTPGDPGFLQAAIGALQTQRNVQADAAAAAEARIVGLNDQIAKLQARIAELEKTNPKDTP